MNIGMLDLTPLRAWFWAERDSVMEAWAIIRAHGGGAQVLQELVDPDCLEEPMRSEAIAYL